MAQRYTVTKKFNIEQPDDSNDAQFDEMIDLPLLLSQRLQKNIRQGHVIKIHKVQLGLKPRGGDLETGMSVSCSLEWCPATRNSVKAWQMAFNTWRAQKRLKMSAVGQGVRYDDFEVAYRQEQINTRTSNLFATGLQDDNDESMCIYGVSTADVDLTLEDIFNSAQPQLAPSSFPLGGTVKPSKFTSEFPPPRYLNVGANWSTIIATGLGAGDSGAAYNADAVYIEDKNSLCGVIRAKGFVLSEDLSGPTADELELFMNITCEISTPLVYKKKAKRTSKKMKSSRRATSTKRRYTRRSRK